jgi:hypothetical protein
LSDAQLRDFAVNFGKLEIGRSAAEGGKRRLALPEIGDISNLDEAGRLRAVSALTAAAGAPPPRLTAQDLVPVGASSTWSKACSSTAVM